MIGFGGLFMSMHGNVPVVVSEVLGETLGIGGYTIVILGTHAFLERRLRPWLAVAIICALPITGLYWSVISPNAQLRVAFLTAWGLANCGWLIWGLRPWVPASKIGVRTRIPVSILIAIYCIPMAAFGVNVALGPPIVDHLTESGPTTMTIAALNLVATFYSLWCMSLLASKMSSALNREVRKRDRMISVLAHDLRTPFNSLMGGAEALRLFLDRGDLVRARDMSSNVHAASGQALSLVESILYWGRNQLSGAQTETVMVADAIREAAAPLQQSFSNKQIELVVTGDRTATVLAEQGGLATIIRNLLSNALKFSPGKSRIDLETEIRDELVLITVRDRGKGMTPAVLKAVRESSDPQSARGTAGETGTGLGLSFCRDLLGSYDGTMEFDSTSAMGTTVRVFLPAGPPQFEDAESEEAEDDNDPAPDREAA